MRHLLFTSKESSAVDNFSVVFVADDVTNQLIENIVKVFPYRYSIEEIPAVEAISILCEEELISILSSRRLHAQKWVCTEKSVRFVEFPKDVMENIILFLENGNIHIELTTKFASGDNKLFQKENSLATTLLEGLVGIGYDKTRSNYILPTRTIIDKEASEESVPQMDIYNYSLHIGYGERTIVESLHTYEKQLVEI